MRRFVVALLALVAVPGLAGADAAAAKPQSFARWVIQEGSAEDAVIQPMTDECVKLFPHDDAKLGAGTMRGLISLRAGLVARWERGIGRIARGQTHACRQAIRAYRAAARRNIKATALYFEADSTRAPCASRPS